MKRVLHVRRPAPAIRVLLIDGQEIARTGTKAMLRHSARIRVVGEAASVMDALEQSHRLHPDVVLLEHRLSDGDGVGACRRIAAAPHHPAVLMLTDRMDDGAMVSALRAGAAAILFKTIGRDDLLRAIDLVARGHSILDRAVLPRIIGHCLPGDTQDVRHAALSVQQTRIMELVVQGKTNKEIAQAMNLSDKTVKNYLSSVYEKLRVTRRAQATVCFLERTRNTDSLRLSPMI